MTKVSVRAIGCSFLPGEGPNLSSVKVKVMTITNKYLQRILPTIAAVGGGEVRVKKGGYETPCPFCCFTQDKERERNKKHQTSINIH